jgi:hypothetical protein
MIDTDDDTVWTNAFYLLPTLPATLLGVPQATVVGLASAFLAWRSARYHTTYERPEQGGDVSAVLTYLVAIGAALASTWSPWALLVPVAVAPLHERFVWHIDSFVATPLYIVACLAVLVPQVGIIETIPAAGLAALAGLSHLSGSGPRGWRHSLWHLFGALAATWALLALAMACRA